MNSSSVREIMFTLPNRSTYKINTNSTVTIKSLKKIVIAAANLSSKNFKLVHNNIDFLLETPNHTVKQLFADNEKIIFQERFQSVSKLLKWKKINKNRLLTRTDFGNKPLQYCHKMFG